jgi:hypothetical protein
MEVSFFVHECKATVLPPQTQPVWCETIVPDPFVIPGFLQRSIARQLMNSEHFPASSAAMILLPPQNQP